MTPRIRSAGVLATVALSAAAVSARAQEPPPPPPPEPSAPVESSSAKAAKHAHHLDEFLIHGTVFDDKAFSLPGAQLRIKRVGEKKYHWSTYTNSRGEFAIRVPPGSDYEVVVLSKGFAEATQPVDAKNGLGDDNLVFRMALAPEKKK
jgi:hypothetical protein